MDELDDPVPVFGSWRRIYVAVLVCLALVMGAIAVFSGWRY